ncbi:peptidase associated/transthyretin-like domain-containing protein [Flavobacterium branchiicola]|uniref:Carboxypeptidase-like protein n=1 Tax=Flavobacterium branchiicola TaxID=1114875 RepID=A0ABV9PDV7_9FLAO|nr:hypothetical protein [Flavobacterium branchiicola]MBS7253106.1 hypothetical protein [Flavobacterium branchiicola]
MRSKLYFLLLLFCSCINKDKFNGYVYDYDTEKPIKNVIINSNGGNTQTDSAGFFCINIMSNKNCKIIFKKEDYLPKSIERRPDSLGQFSKRNLNYNRIYLYAEGSDFSK